MTKAALRLLMMASVLTGCGQGTAAVDQPLATADSRDSVLAVTERLTRAAISKDVDAFMQLWEQSDSVVYSRHGRTFVGWEEIRAEHERAFSATEPWSAEAGPVYVHSLSTNAGVGTAFTRLSSPEASSWFITTVTVQQSGGAWRIVQAHASYAPPGVTPRGEPEQ